jgi:hypothetical protein
VTQASHTERPVELHTADLERHAIPLDRTGHASVVVTVWQN